MSSCTRGRARKLPKKEDFQEKCPSREIGLKRGFPEMNWNFMPKKKTKGKKKKIEILCANVTYFPGTEQANSMIQDVLRM